MAVASKFKHGYVYRVSEFGEEFYKLSDEFIRAMTEELKSYVARVDTLLDKHSIPKETRRGIYGTFLNPKLASALGLSDEWDKAVSASELKLIADLTEKDRQNLKR